MAGRGQRDPAYGGTALAGDPYRRLVRPQCRHADWFQADGTHFKTSSGSGANAYADLIAGSIPPPPTTTTAP
ncbi:MAG: hypothetical protein DLM65_05420 [Candidatus Aeolococcus gillhamiae]|uniref:Uncharacterized protein n=1 Tax=Candidatus Aeolococcus gillhamiae TaxID=3127015 RepID=A0A2W5ZFY1_9BACT|nr:MAG: hypothetical protein DLM65_05420 [Candidatus Dormibacter sp. RRmetagenome_bin12]